MLDIRTARDRAFRRAVETGEMPNFDLIHNIQKTEGNHPCFGRCEGLCGELQCRWRGQCMALSSFAARSSAPSGGTRLPPFQRLPRLGAGVYRDGSSPDVEQDSAPPAGEKSNRLLPTAVTSPAPQPAPAGRD